MKQNYLHNVIPEITTDFLNEGTIIVRNKSKETYSQILDTALLGYRIALRIGVKPPVYQPSLLSNHSSNDNLVFNAPLNSVLTGRNIYFLRGWTQFDSCIKGFNSVGLMAEHVGAMMLELKSMNAQDLLNEKKKFLSTRVDADGKPVYSVQEINSLSIEEASNIHSLDLSLWKCFGIKTIVCSTSSNMGISLHQFLRYMQKTKIEFLNKTFNLLNPTEGRLIIWCPDENADFMNQEKSDLLRSLEEEKPRITTLRTYINRTQRDPGALRDALLCGGYFFPTNPQSSDEVQNLLFVALTNIAKEKNVQITDLFEDDAIKNTLKNLSCVIESEKLFVDKGIEGGISGLMIPYLIMLEENLGIGKAKAISAWNQASIGAALAAAVLADCIIRTPEKLSDHTRAELSILFPNISRFLDNKKLGKEVDTRVHGVFDIANLQSLAQLLGVVVEKHLTGRGTAYVGLGSSSYSNGNRCYEILRDSMENNQSFKGKSTFHPATHTLNPFAQALVYGEEVYRIMSNSEFNGKASQDEKIKFVMESARKPEPAGAAAYAGYLLSRLDDGTLSLVEIVYILKLFGFTKPLLLKFFNLTANEQGVNKFLQEAYEEGKYMGDLAKNIFLIIDWSAEKIESIVKTERVHSHLKYRLNPLDDLAFDNLNPRIHIYLTGDNTTQPSLDIANALVSYMEANKAKITRMLSDGSMNIGTNGSFDSITFTSNFFIRISKNLNGLEKAINSIMKRIVNRQIANRAKKIGV
jgi:hypothetical protein